MRNQRRLRATTAAFRRFNGKSGKCRRIGAFGKSEGSNCSLGKGESGTFVDHFVVRIRSFGEGECSVWSVESKPFGKSKGSVAFIDF
uniref:Uncharacterized protein n=1 Tax=Panagrolaimus sp. JU765 TaxID=591449 RepID=A0AC34QNM7_9BILA